MPYKNHIPGIYTIFSKIDHKIYVGLSLSLQQRITTHKVMLRANKHHNPYLQYVYNKYGESNFEFEILEECEEQFLYSQENYWSNLLDSHNSERGYNIATTGPVGQKCGRPIHTPESKEKLRKAFLGKKMPQSAIEKTRQANIGRKRYDVSKEILQFDKEGNFIKEFKSIADANRELNTYQVSNCLRGAAIYAANSLFKYKSEYNGELVIPRKNSQKRKVLQYDLEMNFIREWDSLLEASVELGIGYSAVKKGVRDHKKVFKKYYFKYKDITNG